MSTTHYLLPVDPRSNFQVERIILVERIRKTEEESDAELFERELNQGKTYAETGNRGYQVLCIPERIARHHAGFESWPINQRVSHRLLVARDLHRLKKHLAPLGARIPATDVTTYIDTLRTLATDKPASDEYRQAALSALPLLINDLLERLDHSSS